MMATSALRTCSRKTTQTSATIRLSSTSVRFERVDGAIDELGAVVDGQDLGAVGQARLDLRERRLDVVDDGERVLPVALDGDAGDDLALAVELGDAAPLVGRKLDARHVAQEHRRAAFGLEHDLLEVGDASQVAAAAHHELGLGELDHAAADVHVGGADRVADLGQRDVEAP